MDDDSQATANGSEPTGAAERTPAAQWPVWRASTWPELAPE